MTETASLYGPVIEDMPLVTARLRSLAAGHHPLLGDAIVHVFESGGKRIRPALVLLSGKLGSYALERLVTLATAIEVVHAATLVHDDTIDGAHLRRGVETVNATWDAEVAILVGDFLFAQSAELGTQLEDIRIMALLSETVMAMSSGELLQYAATRSPRFDEADYFQRIGGKTASLFAMCCQGAAIVSDQSEEQIDAMRSYGINVGLAFQIVDDVLDFSGDEGTLGKPVGSDLRQGKITLPVILLAQNLPAGAEPWADPHGADVEEVVRAVQESDVLDRSLERAREYAKAARTALSIFPRSEAKESLEQLSENVISRRS